MCYLCFVLDTLYICSLSNVMLQLLHNNKLQDNICIYIKLSRYILS